METWTPYLVYLAGLGIVILAIVRVLKSFRLSTDSVIDRYDVALSAMREEELLEFYKEVDLREQVVQVLKKRFNYGDTKIKELSSSLQEGQPKENKNVQNFSN